MRHFRLEYILLYLHRISVFTQNLGQTLNQVHYNGKAYGVDGLAAKTLMLDPVSYPIVTIQVGADYNVEFDDRGYVVDFSPVSGR